MSEVYRAFDTEGVHNVVAAKLLPLPLQHDKWNYEGCRAPRREPRQRPWTRAASHGSRTSVLPAPRPADIRADDEGAREPSLLTARTGHRHALAHPRPARLGGDGVLRGERPRPRRGKPRRRPVLRARRSRACRRARAAETAVQRSSRGASHRYALELQARAAQRARAFGQSRSDGDTPGRPSNEASLRASRSACSRRAAISSERCSSRQTRRVRRKTTSGATHTNAR